MAHLGAHDARVAAWWDAVLAGDDDEPHPHLGPDVRARVKRGCLVLSGAVVDAADRDQLVRQARARTGGAVHDVDASRLRVVGRSEKKGLLDQVLIAAYPDAPTARRAGKFVVEHSRVKPKRHVVVEPGSGDISRAVPASHVQEVKKHRQRGESVVVLCVDETEAFRVRELMDEDTRSSWTLAVPPEPASASR
jgi:hypothetical protein